MSNSKLESVGLVTIVAPFAFLFTAAVSLYGWFSNGFVLSRIWLWYAVPLGVRPLSWVTFAGLLIAKAVFLGIPATPDSDKKPDAGTIVGKMIVAIAWPWFALLMAWWINS